MKDTDRTEIESTEKREFTEPKLKFVEPKLEKHGDVAEITGFFGPFLTS